VSGTTYGAQGRKLAAMGLAVVDRTGQVRYRLFDGKTVWVHAVVGPRAFVGVESEREVSIVDAFTGAVVGKRSFPLPIPLVGRSSSDQ
jgi:hypothetical protein